MAELLKSFLVTQAIFVWGVDALVIIFYRLCLAGKIPKQKYLTIVFAICFFCFSIYYSRIVHKKSMLIASEYFKLEEKDGWWQEFLTSMLGNLVLEDPLVLMTTGVYSFIFTFAVFLFIKRENFEFQDFFIINLILFGIPCMIWLGTNRLRYSYF